jgi:5'-nucleotidase
MRILITNDDGINSKGIKILENVAKSISDDVWVVAPAFDQSGVSHSLTLRKPLRVEEIDDRHFAVVGTPTDCIMLARNTIMPNHTPDLVLSGINNGANLAEDITYSGTVAGAIEATLFDIPAVAISMVIENKKPTNWELANAVLPDLLKKILTFDWQKGVFLNVNVPNVEENQIMGIKISEQGQRVISENIIERCDPRGRPYYWVGGATHRYEDIWHHAKEGTDLEAIGKKFISITPLSVNMTHKPSEKKLKEIFCND